MTLHIKVPTYKHGAITDYPLNPETFPFSAEGKHYRAKLGSRSTNNEDIFTGFLLVRRGIRKCCVG